MIYSLPCHPYPTDKTLLSYHLPISISMADVPESYQIRASQLGPTNPCSWWQTMPIPTSLQKSRSITVYLEWPLGVLLDEQTTKNVQNSKEQHSNHCPGKSYGKE